MKTIHRIAVAYAYEWRIARVKNQVKWWLQQCQDISVETLKLIGMILLVPVALGGVIACAAFWLPWCFIFRPIKYGIWNGEDVDKVEGWKNGRKKQPIINCPPTPTHDQE